MTEVKKTIRLKKKSELLTYLLTARGSQPFPMRSIINDVTKRQGAAVKWCSDFGNVIYDRPFDCLDKKSILLGRLELILWCTLFKKSLQFWAKFRFFIFQYEKNGYLFLLWLERCYYTHLWPGQFFPHKICHRNKKCLSFHLILTLKNSQILKDY